jgi:CdiI immunity protein
MSANHPAKKTEINAANFSALHTFLRGYFHEDVADEYGTTVEAADQFCDDAESDERIAVAREWAHLAELFPGDPAGFNGALKKLGSACRLSEDQIRQVSEIFGRYLTAKPQRRVANH